jgi:gamma-glutamylcyclotransferase (GGCT)/AIG2-like uncharacterized protein YtfP
MYVELSRILGRKLTRSDLNGLKGKDESIEDTIKRLKLTDTDYVLEKEKEKEKSVSEKSQKPPDTAPEGSEVGPREGCVYVIAYGSLRPDLPSPEQDSENLVSVKGYTMWSMGLKDYPALREAKPYTATKDSYVYGLLLEVPEEELKHIDQFEDEGNLYNRVEVEFESAYRHTGKAFIYAISDKGWEMSKCVRMVSDGNWYNFVHGMTSKDTREDMLQFSKNAILAFGVDEMQLAF